MFLQRSIFLASLTLAALSYAEIVSPPTPEPTPLPDNSGSSVSKPATFDPDSTLLIESCLSVALVPVTLDERCELVVPDYVALHDNRSFPESNPVVQRPPANTVKHGRGPHAIAFTSKGEAPCMTQIRPVDPRPPKFEFLRADPSQISVPSSVTNGNAGPTVPIQLQYAFEDSCDTGEDMKCNLTLERVSDQNGNEIFPSDGRKPEKESTKQRRKRSVDRRPGGVESRWWKVIDSHQIMISSRRPKEVEKSEESSASAGTLTYEIVVSCSDASGNTIEKSVQVTVEEEEKQKEEAEGQGRVRKRRSMGGEL